MTFIATLIALAIERFFDWSHLRSWYCLINFISKIAEKIRIKSPYIIWIAIVIPFLLSIAIINILLGGILFGFPKLLFQLVILLFCLGPQNLWADGFACINALTQADTALFTDKLQASFGVTETSDTQKRHHAFLRALFIASNQRVFAVIFWFLLTGPVGALLYRFVNIAASPAASQKWSPEFLQSVKLMESILDWIPIRILTFIFALGGEFVKVIDAWRRRVLLGLESSQPMLIEGGLAALGSDEASVIVEDGSLETAAISLLDRSLIIALVIMIVLMAWF